MGVLGAPEWRKSSRCANGTCVEVARVGDQYLIRDSKRPDDPFLSLTQEQWTGFLDGVKAGDFK